MLIVVAFSLSIASCGGSDNDDAPVEEQPTTADYFLKAKINDVQFEALAPRVMRGDRGQYLGHLQAGVFGEKIHQTAVFDACIAHPRLPVLALGRRGLCQPMLPLRIQRNAGIRR